MERRKPPSLRQTNAKNERACATCEHYKARCLKYDWAVKPFHVCDSWAEKSPRPSEKEERLERGSQVVEASGAKTVVIRVDPGGAGA